VPNFFRDFETLLAELDGACWVAVAVQNAQIGARATGGLIKSVRYRDLQALFDRADRLVNFT